jgi:hypothetical protein
MNIRARSGLRFAIASALLVGAYALAEAKSLPQPPIPPAEHSSAGCGPEEIVLGSLSKKYNEAVTWRGSNGDIEMVITQSPKGKTWTLLGVTDGPDGAVACMLDAGKDATDGPDGYVV